MRHAASVLLALAALASACAPEAAPPPEEQGPPVEGTVAVQGAVLPYRIVGQGRPCIVYGSRILYGETYSARLAAELRCVHFDGRVFLPDAQRRDGLPHGIMEAVADIEAVRAQLGMDSIVVMGNSIVGLVAMAYAATHPEHTAYAISVAGPPSVPTASDSAAAYRAREMSAGRAAQHEANRARLDSLQAAHPGRGFIPTYIANGALYWADSAYDATPIFEGVLVNDTLFYDLQRTPFAWPDGAPPVSVPVLVAVGRHDYVVAPNVWSGVKTPFTDLTVHVFEHAGHWPHLEDPDAFDTAVLEWIRAHEARR